MSHVLTGVVEHGDARGRELGFPTANLPTTGPAELDGVWAAVVDAEGVGRRLATVSIGRRPTYYAAGAERLIEVHVLDFAGDLYGRRLRVELVSFIRGQVRFAGSDELIERITADVAETRRLLTAPARTAIPA